MGKANFTEDFKREAVVQITERGYPVAEVAARLGISKYSLYEWKKRYGKPAAAARDDDQAAEARRLKRELQRVTEERDILKKRPRTSPRMQSEERVHRRAQLPRYMAEPHVAEGTLVLVLSDWASVPMPVHAVFGSTRYMDPKVRGFVDLCRGAFRDGVGNSA